MNCSQKVKLGKFSHNFHKIITCFFDYEVTGDRITLRMDTPAPEIIDRAKAELEEEKKKRMEELKKRTFGLVPSKLIPSKTMRDLFSEKSFEFSDFAKATLIWNAPGIDLTMKFVALFALCEFTDDPDLRTQIDERIKYTKEAFDIFEDNRDNRFIYVPEDEWGINHGFFSGFDELTDYLFNWTNCKSYTICKYLVFRDKNDLRVKIP